MQISHEAIYGYLYVLPIGQFTSIDLYDERKNSCIVSRVSYSYDERKNSCIVSRVSYSYDEGKNTSTVVNEIKRLKNRRENWKTCSV